jgi:hypothetical protein
MKQDNDLCFVFDIENALDAQYFSGIFKDEGIPFHLKSFYDSVYDGIFTAQKGFGKMYVPKNFEEKALKCFETFRRDKD